MASKNTYYIFIELENHGAVYTSTLPYQEIIDYVEHVFFTYFLYQYPEFKIHQDFRLVKTYQTLGNDIIFGNGGYYNTNGINAAHIIEQENIKDLHLFLKERENTHILFLSDENDAFFEKYEDYGFKAIYAN